METQGARLDQETWLTVFIPGAVVVGALYLGIPRVQSLLAEATSAVSGETQAMLVTFIGLAATAFVGVLNYFVGRKLYSAMVPWRWLFGTGTSGPTKRAWLRWPRQELELIRDWVDPASVAARSFHNELLPYSAMDPPGGDEVWERQPDFYRELARFVRDTLGAWGTPREEVHLRPAEGLALVQTPLHREMPDVASDLIKAWVLEKVGVEGGVSTKAWESAARFKHLGDAYVSLATAVPVAIGILSVSWLLHAATGLTTTAVTGVLALLAVPVVYWRCHTEALRNWFQWQNDLCRLFYVAYRRSALTTPPVADQQGAEQRA